jgi:hypothetical protein
LPGLCLAGLALPARIASGVNLDDCLVLLLGQVDQLGLESWSSSCTPRSLKEWLS